MKAAFSHWNRRIAPVFDVARQVVVAEVREGRVVEETSEPLPDEDPARKALRLAELGIETLVCGAISRPLHAMVSAYGIRVIPFVAGDLDRVLRAWARGELSEDRYAMPGCRGGGQRRRRRRCRQGADPFTKDENTGRRLSCRVEIERDHEVKDR